MSSWFRRRKPTAKADSHPALAMVLLPNAETPDLRSALAGLPIAADIEVQESVATARIAGGAAGLAHIPIPIPGGDLDGPAAVAWHWPSAAEAVRRHGSHVIVHAASTSLDAVDLRLLHTRLVASVVKVAAGIGVYVGDAMLLRSADEYLTDAGTASRETLPLLSWLGFNPVSEPGGVSGYTTGLTAFGLLELEVRRSAQPVAEVLGALADAANYQLSTGTVLGDGETFGFSETDRRQIRYGPSDFITGMRVAVLDM